MLTDLVTCVALDQCGSFLVTGSRDTTCVVWDVSQHGTGSSSASHMTPRPFQTLYGHDQAVSCVGIMTELDMAVSGSQVSPADILTAHTHNRSYILQGLLIMERLLHSEMQNC